MSMKRIIMVAAIAVAIGAEAAVTVTNVICRQRYPWNGLVDIDYEIQSDDPEDLYFVYPKGEDKRLGTPIVMHTLSGDGASEPVGVGTHRMVWDANADMPTFHTSEFAVTVQVISQGAKYLVVDLSGGTDSVVYPVRYSTTPPDITDDKCRTTELWLRLVLPGTFMMGSLEYELYHNSSEQQHKVRLTKPFYIGVFELTQKQWMLINGSTDAISYYGDCRPVDAVSYNMIRGTTLGAQWPKSDAVDEGSFMGIMRRKTALKFDLPTEAQWEYACRAGTTGLWNSGNDGAYYYYNGATYGGNNELSRLARYQATRDDGHDSYSQHTKVGLYEPNAWGIYDMHGNVAEWCLDGYQSTMPSHEEIDPVGADATVVRSVRGGYFNALAYECHVARRYGKDPGENRAYSGSTGSLGLRLVCLPIE